MDERAGSVTAHPVAQNLSADQRETQLSELGDSVGARVMCLRSWQFSSQYRIAAEDDIRDMPSRHNPAAFTRLRVSVRDKTTLVSVGILIGFNGACCNTRRNYQ